MAGLPPGRGTSAQGAIVFEQKCQSATVTKARDSRTTGWSAVTEPRQQDARFARWKLLAVRHDVFDYVRRAMPYTQSHSLSDDEVYAVTAYLLDLNGIIGEPT